MSNEYQVNTHYSLLITRHLSRSTTMTPQFLAEQVFNHRRALGISQSELADRAGISRNYVSLIERGEASNLSLNVLHNLAAALGVPPAELTGEAQESPQPMPTMISPALRDFAIQAGLSFEMVDRAAATGWRDHPT